MASSPHVLELQKVLTAYSQATKNPALHPGPSDGVVGDRTIAAVITVAPMVPGIPKDVKTAIALLPVAMAFPDGRKKAVTLITNNASYIAKAIAATAVYRTITGGGATMPAITPLVVSYQPPAALYPPVSPVSTWSKTPVGIAVIAGGVIAALAATALVVRSLTR